MNAPAHAIVTLTMNPSLDQSTTVERVVPQKKLRCSRPRYEPGGGGINVSRALRRLGGDSVAIFPAGGDAGKYVKLLLAEEGVIHRAVPIVAGTRINVAIEATSTHEDYRFVMPGAKLTEAEWQACLDELAALPEDPGVIVSSGSLPPGVPENFNALLAAHAKQRGARFVLDCSGRALELALAEGVFLFKPNLGELSVLAGRDFADNADLEGFARGLVESGKCAVALVSLGAAGALFVTGDEALHLRSPSVPIRSRVGAGDSTVAGFVLGLSRGLSLKDAAIFGVAAGAAAVMTPGSELCRREDAERLFEAMRTDPMYAA